MSKMQSRIAFEGGHANFKDADYTELKEVKNFVDHRWSELD